MVRYYMPIRTTSSQVFHVSQGCQLHNLSRQSLSAFSHLHSKVSKYSSWSPTSPCCLSSFHRIPLSRVSLHLYSHLCPSQIKLPLSHSHILMLQFFHHIVICWPPSTAPMSCTGKPRSGHIRPHQDRAEQKDPLPQPTGKAFAAAPQEAAGHLCQRTHSWLTSTLYPPGAPVFFWENCFPTGQTPRIS